MSWRSVGLPGWLTDWPCLQCRLPSVFVAFLLQNASSMCRKDGAKLQAQHPLSALLELMPCASCTPECRVLLVHCIPDFVGLSVCKSIPRAPVLRLLAFRFSLDSRCSRESMGADARSLPTAAPLALEERMTPSSQFDTAHFKGRNQNKGRFAHRSDPPKRQRESWEVLPRT